MPAAAVRDVLPPQDLRDRAEGWGTYGRIDQYPIYRDTGVWPAEVVRNDDFPLEQPETSDGNWYRDGELI